MLRFTENRKWTLILALGLFLVAATMTSRNAMADPSLGSPGDDSGISGGGAGIGDPDQPDGPGKSRNLRRGQQGRNDQYLGAHVAGDGRYSNSAVMWRLYVSWIGFRSFYIRF